MSLDATIAAVEEANSGQMIRESVHQINRKMDLLIYGKDVSMLSLIEAVKGVGNRIARLNDTLIAQYEAQRDREELMRRPASAPSAPISPTSPATQAERRSGFDLIDALFAGAVGGAIFKIFGMKLMGAVKGFVEGLGETILATARAIGKSIAKIKFLSSPAVVAGLEAMRKALMPVVNFINPERWARIGSGIARLIPFAGALGAAGGFVGSVLKGVSRLFLPLTLAVGTYEAISGATERMGMLNNGNLLEKFFSVSAGAVEGIANFLIGSVLDLVKDIASWAAERMGFTQIASSLDGFSFKNVISGVFDAIQFVFLSITDGIKKSFRSFASGDILGGVVDLQMSVVNIIKKTLQPIVEALAQSSIGFVVPDSVMRFFAIDPQTKVADIGAFDPETLKTEERTLKTQTITSLNTQAQNIDRLATGPKTTDEQFLRQSNSYREMISNAVQTNVLTPTEANTHYDRIENAMVERERTKTILRRYDASVARTGDTVRSMQTNQVRTATANTQSTSIAANNQPIIVDAKSNNTTQNNTQAFVNRSSNPADVNDPVSRTLTSR